MRKTLHVTAALIVAAGLCTAQGPNGPRGNGNSAGSALNMQKVQTVTGSVTTVNIGYGMQYPSITVDKTQIKIAPVWYLIDKGFELKAGDAVSVVAAPSTIAADSYLHAIEITNATSKLRIVLRDSSGVPLWSAAGGMGGRGRGDGPMAEGGCLDASTAVSVAGTVDKISMGLGIQMPTLTLKTSDGKLLLLKLGPERILLAADLELKPGDSIKVTYAVATCTEELVALSITTASGRTVSLRGDDCAPAWN